MTAKTGATRGVKNLHTKMFAGLLEAEVLPGQSIMEAQICEIERRILSLEQQMKIALPSAEFTISAAIIKPEDPSVASKRGIK